MRLIKRLLKWAIAAYILMTLAMLSWTFLWPEPDLGTIDQADVIICLGGGMSANGTLAQATLTRVDRCVELYDAGIAPVIIFTGGRPTQESPSAGGQMMRYALAQGVPQDAMIEEPVAQSTLQNALFSIEYAIGAQDFILVTEAFHLPRSYASFHWARWELGKPNSKTFRLVMSEPVRMDAATGRIRWQILARESIAIWFNIARMAAYSVSHHKPIDWLH